MINPHLMHIHVGIHLFISPIVHENSLYQKYLAHCLQAIKHKIFSQHILLDTLLVPKTKLSNLESNPIIASINQLSKNKFVDFIAFKL